MSGPEAAVDPASLTLHPFIRELVDRLLATSPLAALDPETMRRANDPVARVLFGPVRAVERVEDRTIGHGGVSLPARIFIPASARGALVYLHGGGYVLGGPEVYDSLCRNLALDAGCAVVCPDYRLAPEHKFPAAVEDAHAALVWTAGEFGGPMALAGDSAGATLSLAACLLAGERGGPRPAGQVLAFPSTDMSSFDTASHRHYGRGLFLTLELLAFFRDCYLSDPTQALDPLVSPLRAPDLSGQPPTRLILAEHDLLRDEALALARRLQEAGVLCETTVQPGMIHGFFGMHGIGPEENGLAEAVSFLRRVFRGENP
ncbi:alpha/beta hydrolase fold domain-containing protein [Desulfovibrio aminophilus]|uniref:alpha/beta hydrolase n=1 Tax=Desulfovibrio aminophilus TaxID=81425 RepID=UPI00339503B7